MQLPDNIKAILFDLDGTLRENQPDAYDFFIDQAVRLGAPSHDENRNDAIRWSHVYWSGSQDLMKDLDTFERGTNGFWMNYTERQLTAMGCSQEQAAELAPQVRNYMNENYHPVDIIVPGAPAMLKTLREAGYIVGIVTNRHEPVGEYLDEKGLKPLVDFYISAHDAGAFKPDPRIFELGLERAGVEADEAIYIGDNFYADVEGARNVGMTAFLVDPRGVFEGFDAPSLCSATDLLELVMEASYAAD